MRLVDILDSTDGIDKKVGTILHPRTNVYTPTQTLKIELAMKVWKTCFPIMQIKHNPLWMIIDERKVRRKIDKIKGSINNFRQDNWRRIVQFLTYKKKHEKERCVNVVEG